MGELKACKVEYVESAYQYIWYGAGIVTYMSKQPTGSFHKAASAGSLGHACRSEEAGRLSLLAIPMR